MSFSTIISNLGLAALAFFAPIQIAMIAAGALIGIDTLFGVIAAKKEGKKIESRKLSRVLIKMLAYQLLIISAHITQVYLVPAIPLVNITLTYIGISEFMSIGENFTIITGKNFIKFIKDYLTTKLNKVKEE